MKKKNTSKKNSGFTLIELLVTITIFVVLTGVALFNQSSVDNSVTIGNISYGIALTLKQAQNYGSGVRESPFFSVTPATNFISAYGVSLQKKTNYFTLFSDTQVNNVLDGDCSVGAAECLQKYSINRGNYISALCAGANSASCSPVTNLVVLFSNQKLDALIYGDNVKQNYAKITVSSVKGATSSVNVSSIGQIYVSKN